jgi:terminase large subunit-like protein
MKFEGIVARFLADTTREISIEGGFRAGKTTAALWKVRDSIEKYPGVKWFLCRYSNSDTGQKLKPEFERICAEYSDQIPVWNASESSYTFANGSKALIFGLKAADALSRYAKLRGLGVAGILVDEAQEMPPDVALELRGRLSQNDFPRQLIFVSNPLNVTSWIAKQFPTDGSIKGRAYYSVSLYDNAANLPADMIAGLEAAYPPEHAKHQSVILGKRGVNVEGDPVYHGAFNRKLHVRAAKYDPDALLLEGFDFGQHNVAWVVTQRMHAGGLKFLGGILGQELFLEDFLPIAKRYRADWFPHLEQRTVRTCCPPPGSATNVNGSRYTSLNILRTAGFTPIFRDGANAPDVQLAMIERIASHMRHRTAQGDEALAVNDDESRWLLASREGVTPCPFIAQAFESAYVWARHFVSVSNNTVRQPHDDDWFSHGMRCAENIELNFCADQSTQAEIESRQMKYRENQTEGGWSGPSGSSWMGI